MPHFKVVVEQTTVESVCFEIEAKSEQEAREKAPEEARRRYLDSWGQKQRTRTCIDVWAEEVVRGRKKRT